MERTGLCSICGRPLQMHTCMLCGRLVCTKCYDHSRNACVRCLMMPMSSREFAERTYL